MISNKLLIQGAIVSIILLTTISLRNTLLDYQIKKVHINKFFFMQTKRTPQAVNDISSTELIREDRIGEKEFYINAPSGGNSVNGLTIKYLTKRQVVYVQIN